MVDLVFVVGARRSGTNFLQRIVAAHPRLVAVPSESYLFSSGVTPLMERFHHGAVGAPVTGAIYVDRRRLVDAVRALCDDVFTSLATALDPAATGLVERTPDHVRYLDLIGEIYPGAPVLHIVRDGRDVVRSLLSQSWGPDDAAAAADEWRTAIEAGRAAAPSLSRYREVRYEALLADPIAHATGIFEWLGLPVDDEVVAGVAAAAKVAFNVDPAAPHIASGKWVGALTVDQLAVVHDHAGALLAELGYDDAPSSSARASLARQPRARTSRRRDGRAGRDERSYLDRLHRAQPTVQRAFDALGRGRFAELAALLDANARVRVAGPEGAWDGRGQAVAARLVDTLAADEALARGRQVRGDVHPGVPTTTAVLTYDVDGALGQRVLVLTVAGEHLAEIAWYRG